MIGDYPTFTHQFPPQTPPVIYPYREFGPVLQQPMVFVNPLTFTNIVGYWFDDEIEDLVAEFGEEHRSAIADSVRWIRLMATKSSGRMNYRRFLVALLEA